MVKSGDSLSSIAVRFNTSTAELIQLNPDLDGSTTLVVGTRIVVPRKVARTPPRPTGVPRTSA